jgi:uncharacterized 2Fe-2S/4Fe-4S cluster protein (DUF4445 family)
MAEHRINFDVNPTPVIVPTGTLLADAAREAGIDIQQPCGGQGRCGRCVVKIDSGLVRRRSTLRLSPEDIRVGYALACQSVVEGDLSVVVPPQEKIERHLTSDRTATKVSVPVDYDPVKAQSIRRVPLSLNLPTMDDQTDDWNRLKRALRNQANISDITSSLHLIRRIGGILREGEWQVTAYLDTHAWDCDNCPTRLIDLRPGHEGINNPLWGIAIDIGTTTVTLWLVDLLTGEVKAQVAEYNRQISRGEDVISRIIFASKDDGSKQMSTLVLESINKLLKVACKRVGTNPSDIVKASISGNSTMIHLLLGIPAASIRLSPFVTAINHIPTLTAGEVGINIHPEATVDCLPGIASYVGADITAGILSSGVDDTEKTTLFMDVGTNGEIVLGSREWLVSCACSAGPAFEGAGVFDGMRATKGAIEEIWINKDTHEPTYRVIGGNKPRGLCGSGLISILAELFLSGVVDKAGNFNFSLASSRVREGTHGGEYVVVWADESAHGKDIVITHVDIDNLLRAKAAIFAGFTVLADSIGIPLDDIEQVFIGGSFGKFINVEKAIEIGLLPDMPWDRFHFLGNTSIRGAYRALIDKTQRERVKEIASKMTYIELIADNKFYDAFTSALFLPHTNMHLFPSVAKIMVE